MSPLATLEQSAQPALGDRTSLLLPRVARVRVWDSLTIPVGFAIESDPISAIGFNSIMAVAQISETSTDDGTGDLDFSLIPKDPRDPFNYILPFGPIVMASKELIPTAGIPYPAAFVWSWVAFSTEPIADAADGRAVVCGYIGILVENFGPAETLLTLDLFLGKR